MKDTDVRQIVDEKSLESKVQDFLEGAGTPLEMRVLEAFAGKGIGRLPGLRYYAGDHLREIDLVANFEDHFLLNKKHVSLWTSVVVECKKTKYPWVFFQSDSYAWPDARPFLLVDAPIDRELHRMGRLGQVGPLLQAIDECHLANEEIPMAINYEEAFKKSGTPSSIYGAVDSVATYIRTRRAKEKRRKTIDDGVQVFIPVIVVEGQIMVAKRTGKKMDVEKAEHVRLRTWTGHDLLVIDIVTPTAFEQLVSDIEAFHGKAKAVLSGLSLPDELLLKLRIQEMERERERSKEPSTWLARNAVARGISLNQPVEDIRQALGFNEEEE